MGDTDQPKFNDHFSARSPEYATYRPTYPPELVDFLFDLAAKESNRGTNSPSSDAPCTVWEAGCGSGQLTSVLARRFPRIIATDASVDQIEQTSLIRNVEFRVAHAEASELPDHSVDLAIVAQAAHWFDLAAFYAEVRRVVRPRGSLALITYGILITEGAKIDRIIKHFYHETLGAFWPPQRRLVEEGYQSLPFPFDEMPTPNFEMRADWSLAEMLGYVETWSATAALIKANGRAQVDAFRDSVAEAWRDPESKRSVRWPLSMRLGRV